ncbi:MAG: Ku protein [Negativicutes bacterium]|nr:Ku protein [Negativicutes bacterium]
MQRPVWKGWVSFGLVNIPVRLFNAIKKKTVHFHQLRASDSCRIRLQKVCAADGAEVPNDEIVSGFEIAPDNYVPVTATELKSLYPEASRTIEIYGFIDPAGVEFGAFDQSYYLLPDTGAAATYALLLAALRESGRTALSRLILRNKEHLALLKPAGEILALSTLFFADELVTLEELAEMPATQPELTPRDLAMAEQLIESLAADFAPEKYHDEYHRRIMDLLEQKAAGQQTAGPAETTAKANVIDLTAALEASLAKLRKPASASKRRQAHAH